MLIEHYNNSYFDQVVELFKEHGSIARRELKDYSYAELYKSLSHPAATTFCCFKDGKIISIMVSSMLKDHPTWCVRVVCGKKTPYFNPVSIGICALYDYTIEYWENKGIENFLYIQPLIFMKSANTRTRNGSSKLQTYTPYDYYTIKAGQQCDYGVLSDLVKNNVFEEDMIARWCFKL